jgi:group II intron reverse transcriptase/maturase
VLARRTLTHRGMAYSARAARSRSSHSSRREGRSNLVHGEGEQVAKIPSTERYARLRTAETVLGIIHERGKRGLPLEDIYRQLFNPELYLRAYGRLYANKGALTPGVTQETVDQMSLEKIGTLITDIRYERYRWTPVKRVYVPKRNGKLRPLGLPTWSDKILQEVIRMILEAYYECQFSPFSHGFRPGRGCHTALSEIDKTWTGSCWFIEGDISKCFEKIDHSILLSILREKLHDNRFLRLIENMLRAGYLEDWKYNRTLSGCPQGGIVSPILSNIYMDKLDKYVETQLLPAYNRGKGRKDNPRYQSLWHKAKKARKAGDIQQAEELQKQYQRLPSLDVHDPDYRRLRYSRYADDFLLGFIGSKAEAEEIKNQLAAYLKTSLNLELSAEKTLITHARSEAARYLGYLITVNQADDQRDYKNRRNVNGQVELRMPAEVITKKRTLYERNGTPIHRPELTLNSDFDIVNQYQTEYRGLVQYYLLAQNVGWLNRLHWTMTWSLSKTLANKHKTSAKAMLQKYRATTDTPYGTRKCLNVVIERDGKKPLVAQYGGIPLRRQKQAILIDQTPQYVKYERNELLKRLLANTCELCGSTENCEVHHIRKLADLKVKGRSVKPLWIQRMAARRRKTLVVCRACHEAIHAGRPTGMQRK